MKKFFTRKTSIYLIITLLLTLYAISGFYNPLTVTNYSYSSSKLPASFDGFKIVHISDFHCKEFGKQESDLINTIIREEPNIILFTGDSIDKDHSIENYRYLIEGIADIAPIYYINGNHEKDIHSPITEMNSLHEQYNIISLNDTSITISIGEDSINITGIDFRKTMSDILSNIKYADTSMFNILLYHGTDKFDGIAPYNYDLVLSGHTHGGIVCLPFIGGLISNQKEFFPKYDSGVFTVKNSTMISSRGLGDADVPRFHNPREVVTITLHTIESDL